MRGAQCRAAVADILGLRASKKKGTGHCAGPPVALALRNIRYVRLDGDRADLQASGPW